MKRVIVHVGIEMLIPNDDRVSEATQVLSVLDHIISGSELESSPTILFDGVTYSEIVDSPEDLEIGDEVEMPDPNPLMGDMWNHGGWLGNIVDIRGDIADVEDGNGDVFSIELERLTKQ